MPFKLESGTKIGCYLYLEFPTSIGQQYLATHPVASLKEYGSSAQPISLQVINENGSNGYFVITTIDLTAQKWYVIQFDISYQVKSGNYFDPIIFKTTSSFQFIGEDNFQAPQSYITYDQNYAFNRFQVAELPSSTAISFIFQLSASNNGQNGNAPAASTVKGLQEILFYDYFITINLAIDDGAIIYSQLQNGFTFTQNSCNLQTDTSVNSVTAPFKSTDYTCQASGNLLTIVFRNPIATKQQVWIRTGIKNPDYQAVSTVLVSIYPRDQNGDRTNRYGQLYGKSLTPTQPLQTNLVQISDGELKVHWGFKTQLTDTCSNPLCKLFVSVDAGHKAYNNIQFNFALDTKPPTLTNQDYFRVRIRVMYDAVIDSSISHNLPNALNSNINQVFCADQSLLEDYTQNSWWIVCNAVGQLVISKAYTISAKIALTSNVISTSYYLGFGKVEIDYIKNGQVLTNVFNPSSGRSISSATLQTTLFQDDKNFIGSDSDSEGFQKYFGNTQIISVEEKTSYAVGEDQANYIWGQIQTQESYSIVQRTNNPAQAYIFLLKASQAQIQGVPPINPRLRMSVYFNSNLIVADPNLGLTFGLYDATQSRIITDLRCDETIPQCVNQESLTKISGTNLKYNQVIFKTDGSTPNYGQYTFYCGNDRTDSTIVSDFTNCPIFDGKVTTTDGGNVFFALRNAKLQNTFSTSLYSVQENVLDFVVCFETFSLSCGDTSCTQPENPTVNSCSLINGYILNNIKERRASGAFTDLKLTIVNNWWNNDGTFIPTFIRLRGKLSNENPEDAGVYDAVGIFFDDNVQLDKIVNLNINADSQFQAIRTRTTNNYFCSVVSEDVNIKDTCQYRFGQNSNANSLNQASQTNWLLQNGIITQTRLISETGFNYLIPIATYGVTRQPQFINLLYLKRTNNLFYVTAAYRLVGRWSGSLSKISSYAISPNTPEEFSVVNNRLGSTDTLDATNKNFLYKLTAYSGASTDATIRFSLTTNLLFSIQVNVSPRQYGAGLTLVGRGIQAFTNAETQASQCYAVNYQQSYQQLKSQALFCPFDNGVSTGNAGTSSFGQGGTDISIGITGAFNLPQIFNEQYVFSYAISDDQGLGKAINYNNNLININDQLSTQLCTSGSSSQIRGVSYRRSQQIQFRLNIIGSLPLDVNSVTGTSQFQVLLAITSSVPANVLQFQKGCSINGYSQAQYTCVLDTTNLVITVTFINLVNVESRPQTLTFNLNTVPNQDLSGVTTTITPTLQVPQDICKFNPAAACVQAERVSWIWGSYYNSVPAFSIQCSSFSIVADGNQILYGKLSALNIQLESLQIGVRSQFKITIQPDARMSVMLQNEVFQVDLGWLASVQSVQFNCIVLNSQGNIDYSFDRIQRAGFSMLNLIVGKDTVLSANSIWILQCGSGSVVPNPVLTSSAKVTWLDTSLQNTYQISDPFPAPTLQSSKSLSVKLLQKKFNSEGADAQYIFSIQTPQDVLLSPTVSVIIVEFYWSIPPKLNSQEIITCYINEIQADCDSVRAQRLEVKFPETQSQTYILRILGVSQPSSANVPKIQASIWVALIPDGQYNSVQYGAQVAEIPPSNPFGTFNILKTSIAITDVRASATHQITMTPPLQSIVKNNPFIVYFWYTLQPNVITPTCSLKRVNDNYDWVQDCVWDGFRSLLVTPRETDGNITATYLNYILQIYNGPSIDLYQPNTVYNTLFYRIYFQSSNVVTYQSRYFYTQPILFSQTNTQQDISFTCKDIQEGSQGTGTDICPVYVGYFSNQISISTLGQTIDIQNGGAQSNQFIQDFNVEFTGRQKSQFTIYPSSIQVRIGQNAQKVKIGAKYDTNTGIYIIQSKRVAIDQGAAQLYLPFFPFIQIKVQNKKCTQLTLLPSAVLSIVIGTQSFPVKIDFSQCIPVEEVVVVTIVKQPSDQTLITIDEDSQTLRNDGTLIFTNPYVSFVFSSVNLPSAIGQQATASFQIIGQNGANYSPPADLIINIIDVPTKEIPKASAAVISNVLNELQAQVSCDQDGSLFYSLYLAESPFTPQIQEIVQKTQKGKIQQVPRAPGDQYWQVFGYQPVSAGSQTTISIQGVRMNSFYNFDYYCVSQNKLISNVGTKRNIQTPDNQSIVQKLNFIFAATLSVLQQEQLSCFLSQYFVVPKERVILDTGVQCPEDNGILSSRLLQSAEGEESEEEVVSSSSSTTSSASLTTNNNNVITHTTNAQIVNSNIVAYFLRDFSTTSDTLQSSLTTAVNSLDFTTNLEATGLPTVNKVTLVKLSESQQLPQLNISSLAYIGSSSNKNILKYKQQAINMELTINNMNGFLLVALGSVYTSIPNVYQLLKSQDGDQQELIFNDLKYIEATKLIKYTINNVHIGSDYFVYICALAEDPSESGRISGVIAKPVLASKINYQSYSETRCVLFTILVLTVSLMTM